MIARRAGRATGSRWSVRLLDHRCAWLSAAAQRPDPRRTYFRGFVRAAIRSSAPRPAGVERRARLVQVDHHRRVVGRRGRPLAGLAVDLRPDDPATHRRGRVEEVDPHPLVAVEHPGPVVPPREAAARPAARPGSASTRPQARSVGQRRPLRARTRASRRAPWPELQTSSSAGRHVVVAAQDQRPRRASASRPASATAARTSAACPRRTASPPSRPLGAYRLATRTPPQTADTIRASWNGSKSSSPAATAAPADESRTGPSPKFVTTSSIPTRLRIADAVPAPLAVVGQLVAEHPERHDRRIGVGRAWSPGSAGRRARPSPASARRPPGGP